MFPAELKSSFPHSLHFEVGSVNIYWTNCHHHLCENPEKRKNYDNSGVDADGSIIDLQEIVDDILGL
jgi:hypothetical protein